MYPTDTLGDAPPLDDVIGLGGAGAALNATVPVHLSQAERTQGGLVGTDAGAETGPYATITTSSTGARRALAEQLFTGQLPEAGRLGPAARGRRRDRARDRLRGVRPAALQVDKPRQAG